MVMTQAEYQPPNEPPLVATALEDEAWHPVYGEIVQAILSPGDRLAECLTRVF